MDMVAQYGRRISVSLARTACAPCRDAPPFVPLLFSFTVCQRSCLWLIMGLPERPVSHRHGTQEVNSWKLQRLLASSLRPCQLWASSGFLVDWGGKTMSKALPPQLSNLPSHHSPETLSNPYQPLGPLIEMDQAFFLIPQLHKWKPGGKWFSL